MWIHLPYHKLKTYLNTKAIKEIANKKLWDDYPVINFPFTWTFKCSELFVYILSLYCLDTLSPRYQYLTFIQVNSIYPLLLRSPIVNYLLVTSGKYCNPLFNLLFSSVCHALSFVLPWKFHWCWWWLCIHPVFLPLAHWKLSGKLGEKKTASC